MRMRAYSVGTCLVAVIGGGYAVLASSAYLQAVIGSILVYTIAVSGLNLLAGYGGYPNLSQATFMGISAYGAAWMTNHHALGGFWVQLLVMPLLAAVVGLLAALPLLRLKGQYFAIATLLLGVVLTTVLTNYKGVGGAVGIGGFQRPFADPRAWLLMLVVVAAVVTLVMARLATWPMGRHLGALRRDEPLSESIGIPVYRRKLQAFVIGSLIGGLSGVLLAYDSFYISPDLFTFYESFLVFVALVVGGSGTISGPLLGSIFLVGLPEVFRFADEGRYLVMGVIFVAVMAFMPDGIAGLGPTLRRLAGRGRRDRGAVRERSGTRAVSGLRSGKEVSGADARG